jgi:hypothetical protein
MIRASIDPTFDNTDRKIQVLGSVIKIDIEDPNPSVPVLIGGTVRKANAEGQIPTEPKPTPESPLLQIPISPSALQGTNLGISLPKKPTNDHITNQPLGAELRLGKQIPGNLMIGARALFVVPKKYKLKQIGEKF